MVGLYTSAVTAGVKLAIKLQLDAMATEVDVVQALLELILNSLAAGVVTSATVGAAEMVRGAFPLLYTQEVSELVSLPL